ncbi:MAG: hypothetical protein AB8H86_26500 [Polyangiales bacterium]
MSSWITVYCRVPVGGLSSAAVLSGIRAGDENARAGVDYFTLAEQYEGVNDDDDAVSAALSGLRLCESDVQTEGLSRSTVAGGLRLHYGATKPVILHHWNEPGRLDEELQECRHRQPSEVANQMLSACCEIVGIELQASQLRDFGVVLAYELARYLAQKGDAVLVDDEGRWFVVVDGVFEER